MACRVPGGKGGREDQRQSQSDQCLVRGCRLHELMSADIELLLEELPVVSLADGLPKELRTVQWTLVTEELAQRVLLVGVTAFRQLLTHPADEPWPRRER